MHMQITSDLVWKEQPQLQSVRDILISRARLSNDFWKVLEIPGRGKCSMHVLEKCAFQHILAKSTTLLFKGYRHSAVLLG